MGRRRFRLTTEKTKYSLSARFDGHEDGRSEAVAHGGRGA